MTRVHCLILGQGDGEGEGEGQDREGARTWGCWHLRERNQEGTVLGLEGAGGNTHILCPAPARIQVFALRSNVQSCYLAKLLGEGGLEGLICPMALELTQSTKQLLGLGQRWAWELAFLCPGCPPFLELQKSPFSLPCLDLKSFLL